jgi:hypothetical protein
VKITASPASGTVEAKICSKEIQTVENCDANLSLTYVSNLKTMSTTFGFFAKVVKYSEVRNKTINVSAK